MLDVLYWWGFRSVGQYDKRKAHCSSDSGLFKNQQNKLNNVYQNYEFACKAKI